MEPRKIIEHKSSVIHIQNLIKSFGDFKVLKGIDLELFKGENLVVLGRSGSGKSVLIKIISGLLQADSGTVSVLGQDMHNIPMEALYNLRRRIGFSFQNSALYDSMTVSQNLEFPLVRNQKNLSRKDIERAIDKVLDDVGLEQTKKQMPSELSGGQKKRIGIARTLILNPEIMLYDEPTAGLDPITCIEINHLINEVQIRFNTSSIIITHDLTCAKVTGDRMAMILDGRFERVGSFEEVFESGDSRIQPFFDYNFIK
jgi:phospholipid/cholesterol/gamma-HCH transport system ATP-binding protein